MAIFHYRETRDVGQCINAALHVIRSDGRVIWRTLLFACLPSAILAALIFVAAAYAQDPEERYFSFELNGIGPLALVVLPLLGFSLVMMDAISFESVRVLASGGTSLKAGMLFSSAIRQVGHYFVLYIPILLVNAVDMLLEDIYGRWFTLLFSLPLSSLMAVNVIMAPAVRAMERKGIGGCWGRGFALVRQRWWKSWWVVLASNAIWVLFSGLLTLPFGYLYYILATVGGFEPASYWKFQVVIYPIALLITYGMFPFVRLVQCFWYFTLTEQQESTGLADRVARLDHL